MAHVDQLLEEYLRVINAKDDEIQGLIRGLEEKRCELKKQEGTHRTDVVSTKQELRRALKRLKRMEQQHRKDDEDMKQLVSLSEAAKMQVLEMEKKLMEASREIDGNREKHARELEDVRQQHYAEVQALRKERDELKTEQASLQHERECVRKARETCESRAQQLQAMEAAKEELRESLMSARREMESMVPARRHEEAIAAHAESLRSVKEGAAAEISGLKVQLSAAKTDADKCRNELGELQQLHTQLQKRCEVVALERDEVRQELHAERERFKKLSDSQQREVGLARDAAATATTELDATTLQLKQNEIKLRTLKKRMGKVLGELEMEREGRSKECEKMRLQLSDSHARAENQHCELERMQRKLEKNVAELKECQSALATAKEEVLRVTVELKERLAATMAERDRFKEEGERVAFERKNAQHQLDVLQERSADDRRILSVKVDDANITIDRMREQLKEKEHQMQMLVATQEKRLQEVEWAHKSEVAGCKTAWESELRDLRQCLESANMRLAEETASGKVYQRDVQAAHEAARRSREECERQVADTRESLRALEDAKREVSSLREELMRQQKLLDTASDKEARLQRSVATMESERAADARRCESLTRAIADLKEELEAKCNEMEKMRRELKMGNDESARADSLELTLKLRDAQGQVEQLQRERERLLLSVERLQERTEATERAQRDTNEELHRVNAELQRKAAESTRVEHHAREVEALAKRNCEELEREIARQNTVMASLQQDASLLAEERAKAAVFEERLRYQADLNRRDVDALRSRITSLEEEVEAREAQLQQQLAEARELATQFATLQNRTSELEETLTQKEKKHALRKEALRKALEQVDLATERKLEAEKNLAKERASREKGLGAYKAEVQRLQEQLQAAHEAQHAAERHLLAQEDSLAEATRAVSDGQAVLQERLAHMKQQQFSHVFQHTEELNGVHEQVDALGRELSRARVELREAEESKRELHQYVADVQRRLAATYGRLLSNFAEDAIITKEAFGDFAISLAARTLRHLGQVMHEGLRTAVSFKQQCGVEARQQEAKLRNEIEELKRVHADEVRAAVEERNREVSKMVVQHGTDIAHLRQEIADVTARANWEGESTLREYRRKEEQFHRDKTDLECAKLEIAHQGDQIVALKEQLRSLEQQTEAERTALDQEKRSVRQQQERIRRQLNDCAMEQNQHEVEVRELRSELSALQHALEEKETALAGEREKSREQSRRLIALNTAKETLQVQVDELRRQLQQLQQQLSVARQGAQQASRTGALEQNRLEERIAELTSALNALGLEKRRLDRQTRNDEKKITLLEKELTESRKRESELCNQLQARRAENAALKERCANLESLKNIGEVTLSETRLRERDLLEKMEEMRSAQQLMQLCFDKQQEQLEVGRRMHEQDVNRSGLLYKEMR